MCHSPIVFKDVSLSFPHKICFENFNARIHPQDRIAIIGRNGAGKSTLLKMLLSEMAPSSGEIQIPADVRFGNVPQIIQDYGNQSGGQRLNKSLTEALAQGPNVLLLDEPTNHLDLQNRKSLLRMLRHFPGTLIMVSHDVELLRHEVDTLWHIDQGAIHIFKGRYEDYRREITQRRAHLEGELAHLNREKQAAHQALMREQNRAKNSRASGEKHIQNRKWPTVVSAEKACRAAETSGKKKFAIRSKKEDVSQQLQNLRVPEIIVPQFWLSAPLGGDKVILSIREGQAGYGDKIIIENIHISLHAQGRLAIRGPNGAGKSTLIKAILKDPHVHTSGEWRVPKREGIGYLDQNYGTLLPQTSVLETIQNICPSWTTGEIRTHLNDFLFRKNEEVKAYVSTLSGGEKARLSLAQIAAKTPQILILDEMTNNLDLETRDHVIQVLRAYPGALILISHDEDFLHEVGVSYFCDLLSL